MKRVIFGIMAMLAVIALVGCPEPSPSPTPAPAKYTVTFNANGGTGTAPAALTQSAAGKAVTLPGQGQLTKSGSVFGGWSEATTGTNPMQAGHEYTPTKNTTLYAVWAAVGGPSVITLNVNGGTGTIAVINGTIGTAVTLPGSVNTAPTGVTGPTGKTNFIGWAREADAEEPDVGFSFTPTAATHTLYAVWSATAATVATLSFDANGGTGTIAPITGALNSSINLPVNTFTAPEGKTFKGWGTTATATSVLNVGDSFELSAVTITLFAIWETGAGPGPGPGPGGETGTDRAEFVAQTNNWFSMYRFVIPAGKTWADYAGIEVSYMFDAEHLASARARNGRIYGPYEPEDFSFLTGTTDGKTRAIANLNNQNATHILDDAGLGNSSTAGALLTALAAKGITPVADEWFTCGLDFYKIDGSRKNSSYTDAKLAALMASTGPLYMTVGLPAGGNGDPANEYYIRDFKLIGIDPADTIVATSLYFEYNGEAVPAYLGYPTTDGSNGWDDSYRISIDDVKTVVPAATGIEKLNMTNNWYALYKFTIPDGLTWADYEGISADYYFTAADLANARTRNGRLYGPYYDADLQFLVADADDTDARFVANLNSMNATHILDDIGMANDSTAGSLVTELGKKGVVVTGDEWFTLGEDFYKIDGSRKNGSYTTEHLAQTMAATGDLYIGIGLPAGGSTDPANVYYIKNITLIGVDPANTIKATPCYLTHYVDEMEDVVVGQEPDEIPNPDYDQELADAATDEDPYDVPETIPNPNAGEDIVESQPTGEKIIDPDYPNPIPAYLGWPTTNGSNGWDASFRGKCDLKFK